MKRKFLISLGLAIGCGATQAQTILPDTVRPSIILTDGIRKNGLCLGRSASDSESQADKVFPFHNALWL